MAGQLALPGQRRYDVVRRVENPRYDTARPLAVLSVASAADVATAIKFAQDHHIPVAVRSGGHSYPGWSAGGTLASLVIDCRPLARFRLRRDMVEIGAGAALAPIYDQLGARGLAVPGGSCPTVGIAGLTLGGGVGVLSRAMGLTSDAVRSMKVVTADGRVQRVSAEERPDLYWALRGGGGGHLGVVTSFEFTTAPAPVLNTFYLQWPLSAAADVVDAWQHWAPTADTRLWSSCKALGGQVHPSGPVVLAAGTWIGSTASLDRHLAGLLRHVPQPAASTTHTRSYRDAMLAYAGCSTIPATQCNTGPGGSLTREAFGATSHVMYNPLDSSGIDTVIDHVTRAQSSGLREAGLSIDALGGRVHDVPAAESAFVHRDALATVQYTATYASGGPAPADAYVREFRRAMLPHWGNHAYVNYADPTIVGYRDAYFGANATRLAQVRQAYDPHHFFTQPQNY